MSPFDHEEGEMRGFPLDEKAANALVDGKVVADDAPPGYEHVARLVGAATAPPSVDELAGQDHVVATLAAAVGGAKGVSVATHGRRRPMLTKLLTVKMAAAASAALLGGGAAAAATGSLPTSLQTNVSQGLSHVGISVPDPAVQTESPSEPSTTVTDSTGTTTTTTTTTVKSTTTTTTPTSAPSQAVGPTIPGPELEGLCTAYAASSGSQADAHSVAFHNLAAAAAATTTKTVAEYCAAALTPAPSAGTSGSTGTSQPSNSGDHTTETTEPPGATHGSNTGDHGSASTSTTTTTSTPSNTSSTDHTSSGDSSGKSGSSGGTGQGGGDGGSDN